MKIIKGSDLLALGESMAALSRLVQNLDPERMIAAVQATPQEIAEGRRRCWRTGCQHTVRLEWCGWRYCWRHYWTNVLKGSSTWRHLLVKLRFTRIARP